MSRFHSYINSAKKLIETYQGDVPFAVFVRRYFAANKKYGAQDRRQINALCYDYFRLGFAAAALSTDEKLLLATFLCEQLPSEMMEKLRPEWNKNMALPLAKKLVIVKKEFKVKEIFPLSNELSDGIDAELFTKSFLIQPDLFIRLRPFAKVATMKKLERSKLVFEMPTEDCVQLPQGTKVEDHFIPDKEVVIQDYNSQQVLNFLKSESVQHGFEGSQSKTGVATWDCCAASGGKSILLTDIFHKRIDLTVSDIRASIVLNLHQRFMKAGIKAYKYFISDVGNADFTPVDTDFELIICDAPCSGSGTWSRTPEQVTHFKENAINEYSALQKRIVTHVMPHLRTGGIFIYITCSVFRNENENVVDYITENFSCKLLEQKVLAGYQQKADSMFVAVFKKGPF